MKTLLMLVLLAAAAFVGLYYALPSVREKVRTVQMKPDEQARFDAYQTGKAIIRKQWPAEADVVFTVWGDDELVAAKPLKGDVWMASGRVALTLNNKAVNEPWLCIFNQRTGALIQQSLGSEASAALAKIASGENAGGTPSPKAIVEIIAPTPKIKAKATPKPGAWMFEEPTALDRKPQPHR